MRVYHALILMFAAFPAFAATEPELTAAVASIQTQIADLEKSVTKGRIDSSRWHTGTGSAYMKVRSKVRALQKQMPLVSALLAKDLAEERRLQMEAKDRHAPSPGKLKAIEAWNTLYARYDGIKIVADDTNTLGKWGGSEPLIQKEKAAAVVLTPFDYTVGFAFQCKSDRESGLVAHRNSASGEILWRAGNRYYHVAVTGDDSKGEPLLAYSRKDGIASAWDPEKREWVLVQGGKKKGAAAVYNPALRKVETYEATSQYDGISGVYNPLLRKVEWKTFDRTGVAGYFDSIQGKVIWLTGRRYGMACVWRDSANELHYSSGYGSDYGDDDDD